MHIQGQIPAVESAAFHGIFSNQQPVDARSFERRRRLRAANKDVSTSPSPEELQLIDQWTSAAVARHSEDTPDTGIL